MQKARQVSFPGANLEIKIVLAVALFRGLGGGRERMQRNEQAEQEQTSPQGLSAFMIPARWSTIRSWVTPSLSVTCQIHR